LPLPPDGKRGSPVENALEIVLYGGVMISIALFLIGLLYSVASSQAFDFSQTETLGDILNSIAAVSPIGIISLGVLIIIATPIVRIIMTAVYFAKRDKLMTVVPIVVLSLIVVGFVLSVLR
jgi:uncharacterized membrane protein